MIEAKFLFVDNYEVVNFEDQDELTDFASCAEAFGFYIFECENTTIHRYPKRNLIKVVTQDL